MTTNTPYRTDAPTRDDIDRRPTPTLIEFGTDWCGHCRAAQPALASALSDQPGLELLKIEDGPGRPLGRSFRVKLWPTFVLVRQGRELARCVRPTDPQPLREMLAALATPEPE